MEIKELFATINDMQPDEIFEKTSEIAQLWTTVLGVEISHKQVIKMFVLAEVAVTKC